MNPNIFPKIKSFLRSELVFFLFISILLMGISMSVVVKRYQDTPPDRVFSGLEFYSDDYSIYVSNTFQGQRGRWTLLDKHTTEPHEGTIIHDEYLLWGKFMGIFKIDPILSYHLARLCFGFVLLGMIYLFFKEIFTSKNKVLLRKLAFFLVTFATGFVTLTNDQNDLKIAFHMSWLTENDIFYRFVALPHYLLGNIFFLGSLISFLRIIKHKKILSKELFLGVLNSVLLALVHPVSLVSLMALFGIYLLFANIAQIITWGKSSLTNFQFLFKRTDNLFFLVSLLFSAPIVLYYRSQFSVPPWNHMAAWEGVTQYFVPLAEFGYAIGTTFFLGILSFIGYLLYPLITKKKINFISHQAILLLFSWIASFFLLFYFSYPYLRISQVRFMQVFIYIPFAALSAFTIVFVCSFFKKIGFYLLILSILLITLIGVPYYYQSLQEKFTYYKDLSVLVYPYKETVDGYFWLRDNTSPNKIVLTAFLAGTQIPYFSNNTVYVGHMWATLNRKDKEVFQYKFLDGKMEVEEAYKFFKDNNINYYFQGFQEKSYKVNPADYPFLKKVFDEKSTTIYEFVPR